MGNPTSYYNSNRWTFKWAQGRRLTNASDGTNTISYTYDADGLRTSKTVNGVEHTYYYAGGRLLRETFGGNTLDFFYDSNGNAYAVKYKWHPVLLHHQPSGRCDIHRGYPGCGSCKL